MTYAFTQDVPIDATFYNRITDGLGDAPPEGLVVHLAIERVEGGRGVGGVTGEGIRR